MGGDSGANVFRGMDDDAICAIEAAARRIHGKKDTISCHEAWDYAGER